MGLIPQFDKLAMTTALLKFAKENEKKFINALAFIGEEFVNEARSKRTYQDQTGNLRASIGYAIIKNGKTVKFTAKDSPESGELVSNLVQQGGNEGIYLIVFAGMEYALYVEAKGFDVLTGSKPTRREVISMFKDLLDE